MQLIPITILGGSDRTRSRLPELARRLHPLAAYKGAALQCEGLPLALLLAKRLHASGGFGPVSIAGPKRIFAPLIEDLWRSSSAAPRIVDTDSTVAQNLRAAIRDHQAHQSGPLAILACDVLPTTNELTRIRHTFEADRPSALWFPLIAAPKNLEDLGAFAWKPRYRVAPRAGAPAEATLPGHLAIIKPDRLRLKMLFSLMDAAYRTRNRPVASRRWAMLWRISGALLWADLVQLIRFQPPTRTLSIVRTGLRISAALRNKQLVASDLEHMITTAFVHQKWRKLPRPVQLPIVDILTLAQDIDTEEEAASVDAELRPPSE